MNDDLERGCLLPAFHAGVTFFLLFLLAFGIARWQAWGNDVWVALVTAAAGALMMWASGIIAWRRDVYSPELPAYYPTTTPAQTVQSVRVELAQVQDGARRLDLIDLPASSEQLQALARGLLDGASLSESTWSGGNGLFSRSEFSQLCAELIRRGLARWNNPNTPARGAALTPAGRAVMRQFSMMAGNTTHPTPRG